MDDEARRAAVAALKDLVRGRDYRDRADAGRALASFAERPEAAEALRELVLDVDDTFVTRATTEALLRRMDTVGLATVAYALAQADSNHGDWIHAAVVDVFGVFSRDRDAAGLCGAHPRPGRTCASRRRPVARHSGGDRPGSLRGAERLARPSGPVDAPTLSIMELWRTESPCRGGLAGA
ncbi:hypothetical protein ACQSSU_15915 [Micromonospora echinospora]